MSDEHIRRARRSSSRPRRQVDSAEDAPATSTRPVRRRRSLAAQVEAAARSPRPSGQLSRIAAPSAARRRLNRIDCRRPRHGHRPLQAAGADRRRGHGRGVHGRAGAAGPPQGGAEGHQAGHGHAAGDRPLRGRAAGAGADGPPEHRQGARRRHDGNRPALLRDGAGPGRADHRVLRREPSARSASGWNCSSPSARRSSTPTRRGSSTATSSRSNVLVTLHDGQPVAEGDRLRHRQGHRPAADRADAVHRASRR